MIDAFVVEAVGATACVWFAVAARRGSKRPSIAGRREPKAQSIAGLISELPKRHRRAARAIVEIAREHDALHSKGSIESFTAREALRSYLPDTIVAYLAVPRALRQARRAGRPSPDDELIRQMLTLRSGLERLREADADVAASRMAENGTFLNERFGPPEPPPSQPQPISVLHELVDALGAYLRRV